MVAASQISAAVGHCRDSAERTRPTPTANFKASSIEQLKVTPQPSDPMATLIPAARKARKSATPEPSAALLQGLYCTVPPAPALSARSRGESQTPRTSAVFDPNRPRACRCSTMLHPQKSCAVTTCKRVSSACTINGRSSSSASVRQYRRNSSVQRCGAEGATSTPTRDDLG